MGNKAIRLNLGRKVCFLQRIGHLIRFAAQSPLSHWGAGGPMKLFFFAFELVFNPVLILFQEAVQFYKTCRCPCNEYCLNNIL